MAKTDTAIGLLTVAVQDLYDGELAWEECAPATLSHICDPAFVEFGAEQLRTSLEQARRLVEIAADLGVPARDAPNIWLRAIFDDARRDSRTIAPGVLLDVALVGALRKGKQAERVSYETAIMLAKRSGQTKAAEALIRSRDEEAAADQWLADLLEELGHSIRGEDALSS